MNDQRKDHIDPEDTLKGTTPNNYGLITCLLTIWKILTAQMRKRFTTRKQAADFSLTKRKDAIKDPEAPENYSKLISTYSTTVRANRKNLAVVWINYKKTYDMVPQSWIINCLKMYKI